MRAALLKSISPEILKQLGEEPLEPLTQRWLRALLELSEVRKRIVAVAPHERFDHALERLFGVQPSQDAVVVLYAPLLSEIESGDPALEDIEAAFPIAEKEADAVVERVIAEASSNFDAGDLEEAEIRYRQATEHLQHEMSPRHAEVLSALAELSLLQGDTEQGRAFVDRALSTFPVHQGALRARASIAEKTGESAIAAAMLHRLVDTLDASDQKVGMLTSIAQQSLSAAGQAIASALQMKPGDWDLLERLRAVHEASGKWDEAVSVSVQLAESLPDSSERARAFLSAADLCAGKAKNIPRAVALYEAAIEDDATIDRAFAAIEEVLLQAQDYAGVANAYRRQLARLEKAGAVDARVELLRKLASVQHERLNNAHAAIKALDDITELKPADTAARTELAKLLESIGEAKLAIRCLEVSAQYEPARAETYRHLHQLFSKTSKRDRSYCACGVLVALGEADIDEQLIHAQFAPEAPLAPKKAFDHEVWQSLAQAHHDLDLDILMTLIETPAIDAWIGAKDSIAPLLPDKKRKQNPKKTTVSAVKSFLWASHLLKVQEPEIYTEPDNTRSGATAVPSQAPAVRLGRSVLIGRSSIELAFIAAHHMTYFRPGWRLLPLYQEVSQLEALMRATLALARPDLFKPQALSPEADDLLQRLRPKVTDAVRDELVEEVGRLHARGAPIDLLGWRRSVETIACRAGLLASGDITVAGALLSVSGGHIAGLTAADRSHQLMAFSVSERYANLRESLGIAVD